MIFFTNGFISRFFSVTSFPVTFLHYRFKLQNVKKIILSFEWDILNPDRLIIWRLITRGEQAY